MDKLQKTSTSGRKRKANLDEESRKGRDASTPESAEWVLKLLSEMPPKEKPKSNKKRFQESWLVDPKYKFWLQKDESDATLVKCKCCNKTLQAGKGELDKHAAGKKHQANVLGTFNSKSLTMIKMEESNEAKQFEEQVKSAEIRIAAFFAEYNISTQSVEHFTDLLKDCFPDSKIAEAIKMKKDKCSAIINNVIAPVEVDQLVEILRSNNFSIFVSESTSDKRYLSVVVHYVNPNTGKVTSQLLELVELDATNCTADSIYTKFKECMTKKKIPLYNILGVASDEASVMIDHENYFFSRLKDDVPSVILLRCICHTSVLISSVAAKCLPEFVENFIDELKSYPAYSTKRKQEIEEMVEYFFNVKLSMLKPSETRWPDLQPCVSRILLLWDALLNCLQLECVEKESSKSKGLYDTMCLPELKAYLLFLKYVLYSMKKFNALFQSKTPLVHCVKPESVRLFKCIVSNYLKPNIICNENLLSIDVSNPENFLEIDDMYTGPECEEYLKSIASSEATNVRTKIQQYYITCCKEIQNRLLLQSTVFTEVQFVDPNIALDFSVPKEKKNITKLCSIFEIDVNAAQNELRTLPLSLDATLIESLKAKAIDEMWHEIFLLKDFTGKLMFENICNLAKKVLALPHSSAECERIFSMTTNIKTKQRRRMKTQMLNSCVVIRSALRAKGDQCFQYQITKKHLTLHNGHMYESSAAILCDDESESDGD